MKKILSFILTVCIIAGCVPAFAASAERPQYETPKFRIGVISDLQCNTVNDDGMKYAIKAFEKFKELGVDVVINAGDIADSNAEKIYPYYLEQFHSILPGVEHVCVPGNHDVWRGDKYATYKQNFGEPSNHVVIGGYHFITIASDPDLGTATNGNYGMKSKQYASEELAAAAADAKGEPIFLVTHQHISDTVYLSDSWGNDFLRGIVEDYPNVISFSGHSHAPLDDERSIWQGDFTAIGTCTLSYTELEYGKDNGSVPPNSSDCKEYLYLEIFDNRIDISRIKAQTGKLIKDKWVLDLPLQKSTFKYTDARAETRTAPYFTYGSEIKTNVSGKDVTFSFPAAKHDDFVHSYRIVVKKNGFDNPITDILIFSDFYRGLENMAGNVSYTIKGIMEELQFYTVDIYPIESFGKLGEPLTKQFSSLEDTQLPKLSRGNVFTVDFVNGTPRNATGNAELKSSNVKVEKANGKWAYKADGTGSLYVAMSNSYYTITNKKFSAEAVFAVNDFKTKQTIMSCYKKGGLEMYVDTDKNVKLKVYNENGDIEVAAPITAGEVHDVMVTYNSKATSPGTNDNLLILYIDGERKATAPMSGTIKYNLNTNYYIGTDTAGENPMKGILYTACLNSSAKAEKDVLDLYNANSNGYNLEILTPVLEEAKRMQLLRKKNDLNPGTANIITLINNYLAELTAITDSYYFLPADAQKILRIDEINKYLKAMNAIGLDDTYQRPVISGVSNGERYDLLDAAPAATWDIGEATLNDEAYTAGTPIEEPGKNTLMVWNGDKLAYAQFETYFSYVAPSISGIEDGETYDLYNVEAPSIIWTPADLEGKLDSVAYVAGTPVTELGWHTFMVTDGKTSLVYAFKIIDTTPTVSGVEDEAVYDIFKNEAPSITWSPDTLEGKLDGTAYVAGTPVEELGAHVFTLSDGKTTLEYSFTVVDTATVPVISGVEDGKEYDLYKEAAPAATWDVGEATLNGVVYTAGTPITEIGSYVLMVVNGSKSTTVNFKVIDTATVPVVEGVEDGKEYDLHDVEAPAATWDVGEATLDGAAYTAGTPVTEVGEHIIKVVNGSKTAEIKFTVKDTSVEPEVEGVEDGQEYDLASGKVVLTWGTGVATLNGAVVESGVEITEPGEYTLVVTDGTKTKEIKFTVTDTTPATKKGDFDNDGEITVADALAALRIAAKLVEEDENNIAIGDIDADNHVTVADALAILRVAAKLTDTL